MEAVGWGFGVEPISSRALSVPCNAASLVLNASASSVGDETHDVKICKKRKSDMLHSTPASDHHVDHSRADPTFSRVKSALFRSSFEMQAPGIKLQR